MYKDSSSGKENAKSRNTCEVPISEGSSIQKVRSRFRGVCWNKKNKVWQAAINIKGTYLYLGSFHSEDLAARAFDREAIKHRGDRAKVNFQDSKLIFQQEMVIQAEQKQAQTQVDTQGLNLSQQFTVSSEIQASTSYSCDPNEKSLRSVPTHLSPNASCDVAVDKSSHCVSHRQNKHRRNQLLQEIQQLFALNEVTDQKEQSSYPSAPLQLILTQPIILQQLPSATSGMQAQYNTTPAPATTCATHAS